jgi:hypothetical protein
MVMMLTHTLIAPDLLPTKEHLSVFLRVERVARAYELLSKRSAAVGFSVEADDYD